MYKIQFTSRSGQSRADSILLSMLYQMIRMCHEGSHRHVQLKIGMRLHPIECFDTTLYYEYTVIGIEVITRRSYCLQIDF